jgi:hypothetical protein
MKESYHIIIAVMNIWHSAVRFSVTNTDVRFFIIFCSGFGEEGLIYNLHSITTKLHQR